MSLIGEALKKARQDVARQDALRQRTPYAVGAVDPGRRTSLLPVLAGLGAGCLLAGALVAVAWSAGWGPFAGPAEETVRVAEAAAAAPAVRPSEPAAPRPEPQPVPPALPQAAPPLPSPLPAETVAEERPRQVIEARPTAPLSSPAADAVPAPPSPPSTSPEPSPPVQAPAESARPQAGVDLVDGHTYAGEVPVPGGGTVKLNGIAFSPQNPVAVLDGRVMGPGESIQGFTLVAVESGRVQLQGYGATVYISPK